MSERQFPDPEERARIIARRDRLSRELIEYTVMRSADSQECRAQRAVPVRQRAQVQALPRQVATLPASFRAAAAEAPPRWRRVLADR
jgi:hypothetical protein